MELEEAQEKILSRQQLLDRGIPRRKIQAALESGRWMRLARGVYAPTQWWESLADWERYRARAVVYHRAGYAGTMFTHVTAASLYGLPLLYLPNRLHVLMSCRGSSRNKKVMGHAAATGADQPQLCSTLRVTSPLGTLVDCARSLPVREALIPLEAALWRAGQQQEPWHGHLGADSAVLRKALEQVEGRGAARARAVAIRMGSLSESPGETLVKELVRQFGLAAPAQQLRIGRHRVDFAWEGCRVVLEFDGLGKYTGEDIWKREKQREVQLQQQGWTVLRTTWQEVTRNPQALVHRLMAAGVPLAG